MLFKCLPVSGEFVAGMRVVVFFPSHPDFTTYSSFLSEHANMATLSSRFQMMLRPLRDVFVSQSSIVAENSFASGMIGSGSGFGSDCSDCEHALNIRQIADNTAEKYEMLFSDGLCIVSITPCFSVPRAAPVRRVD